MLYKIPINGILRQETALVFKHKLLTKNSSKNIQPLKGCIVIKIAFGGFGI